MLLKNIIRHTIGYILGITVFLCLIPLGLYSLSNAIDPYINIFLIPSFIARIIITSFILSIGILFIAWSNISLFFKGKGGPTDGFGIAISPRSEKLVISGPYKYTRNPMVFGANSCYIALGIFLNSPSILLLISACIPLIVCYLKKTEEKRLFNDFGDNFLEYKRRVSMIFPWAPKK